MNESSKKLLVVESSSFGLKVFKDQLHWSSQFLDLFGIMSSMTHGASFAKAVHFSV
jgi:hypothetical protein